MKLPARVRVSRLPAPPSDTLRAQLRRLDPAAAVELDRALQGESACAVAIAGGKVVGYLIEHPGGQLLTVEATWRGKGIEDALHAELRGGG